MVDIGYETRMVSNGTVGQRSLLQEVIGMDQSVFLNSSNHEKYHEKYEINSKAVQEPAGQLCKLSLAASNSYFIYPLNKIHQPSKPAYFLIKVYRLEVKGIN